MINFRTVEKYVKAGFACHWLKGKAPFQQEWSTRPVATLEELRQSYKPWFNLGVRVGKWSVLAAEFGLVVLDIDLRNPLSSDACYEAVEGLLGHATLNVASGRGLGGHIYLKCALEKLPGKAATIVDKSKDMVEIDGKLKAAWTLELLSTGKNVVVPPSIHPDTGKPYEWVNPEIGMVPEVLLDVARCAGMGIGSSLCSETTRCTRQTTRPSSGWLAEGSRNEDLFRYACKLQGKGLSDVLIRRYVRKMNSGYLPDWEVEKVIHSALKYQKGVPTKKV
jgi:hypothetical protein